jgi:hypothetical protein|tara:strand:- start:34 stop:225 length:192 start_codon:yes stop_codon:yes gene_type:complete
MKRPDPMISASYGATDIVAQKSRMLWLEELYFLDGRDQISHPQHGLFTGLALKYQNLSSTDGI